MQDEQETQPELLEDSLVEEWEDSSVPELSSEAGNARAVESYCPF